MSARKYDSGKSRMSLIPFVALRALGEVYAYGTKKYDEHNWLKGMAWNRLEDAMFRHYERFWLGEDFDKESGLLHTAHIAWNAVGLLTYQLLELGTDTRWKLKSDFVPNDLKLTNEKTFEELNPENISKED
jgi:hypothetical protein